MKLLFVVLLSIYGLTINAQEKNISNENTEYVAAIPNEGLDEFYKLFSTYIYSTYYRNFKFRKYSITIEINEKGRLKVKGITPKDNTFGFEAKRFLERKSQSWKPATLYGVPVKSSVTIPIKLVF